MTHSTQRTIMGINFQNLNDGRYVCHFVNLASDYEEAIERAKTIGGKAYRAKWYGGGIVFTTDNIFETAAQIMAMDTEQVAA